MRDVQVLIGDYYRATGLTDDPDELGTRVRVCVAFVQVMNELLRKQSGVTADYQLLFKPPEDPHVGIIQGFEYARHLTQHVLHPVRPERRSIIGGVWGLRTYAVWSDVPMSAHGRLKQATQKLKLHYDTHLLGREVTDTLLDAAGFFYRVCPSVVHRDGKGEWTGFPLSHQPGVAQRLHPEEPLDESKALLWMAQRPPGGDQRVIAGAFREHDSQLIVFGFTFVARCAFMPFFETVEQIIADMGMGYPYYLGNVAEHTIDRSSQFNFSDQERGVLCSDTDLEVWAKRLVDDVPEFEEHSTIESIVWWRMQWAPESSSPQAFLTRRERRLNALGPWPFQAR